MLVPEVVPSEDDPSDELDSPEDSELEFPPSDDELIAPDELVPGPSVVVESSMGPVVNGGPDVIGVVSLVVAAGGPDPSLGQKPPNPQHTPGPGGWQVPSGQVTRLPMHSMGPELPLEAAASVSTGVTPS